MEMATLSWVDWAIWPKTVSILQSSGDTTIVLTVITTLLLVVFRMRQEQVQIIQSRVVVMKTPRMEITRLYLVVIRITQARTLALKEITRLYLVADPTPLLEITRLYLVVKGTVHLEFSRLSLVADPTPQVAITHWQPDVGRKRFTMVHSYGETQRMLTSHRVLRISL